jgi:endonuclease/exonuclease/phosphatase family metal-dependent hydrolase
MPLRLATWNVHGCVGGDGRFDPARVLAVLRSLDADVIALQELRWEAREALHLLDHFGHALGYAAIAGPTMLRGDGHYGNALLHRLPLLDMQRVDLSIDRHEPRGAIDALLRAPSAPIRVMSTHLGLRPRERRRQMRRLLRILDGDGDRLTVLMGDLNEWFLWGRPLRWLHSWFGYTPSPRTFPSRLPLFALDRIWVHPRSRLVRIAALSGGCAAAASDHLPVVADVVA